MDDAGDRMQSGGPPATTAPPGSGTTTVSTVTSVPPKPVIPGSSTLRTTPHTSYHVPRGAAAVANIAVPRSGSLATPIVRTGGLVSIRNSARAPSPAPQQSRTRPASTATLPGTRPATPQRTDTSHPSQLHAPEKPVLKGAVSLSQVTGRPATLSSTAPRLSTTQPPSIQSTVQLVTQATTQPVTLPTSQPATLQLVTQPVAPLASQPNSQPGPQPTIVTSNSALNARPRPISQATQAGTPTSLAASTPAVVLATPARLTSPGLLGVTTGPARLAVATALPATNARLVGPPARLQQGRTVTYTSSHQVLQAARLPPAPVRLGPAGRGVVSLHMGVAPLKPSPTNLQSAPQATATLPAGTTSTQPSSQPSSQVTAQTVSQPSPLPTLQPASLRALPTQTKVMTPTVVTVAAVPGGPLRSVVAAVPPGSAPPPTALPPASVSASAPSCKTASAYAQTLTTVAARPVAVAAQPARPGQAQPSVYIQTAHRASPGPTTERTGTYPLPGTTYYYEAPGGYQVAGVAGRSYTGTTPYIVQTTPARAVGTTTQQVQGLVASSVPTCVANAVANTIVSTASGGAASTIAGSVVAGVTGSVVSAVPGSVVSGVAGGVVTSVVSSMASGQPVRFNSVMVVDPTRTALAAYVPAEGGAGTAFIAADSSLLAAQNAPQALPVSASASVQASPQATSQPTPIITQTTPVPSNQTLQQETTQPSLQISGTAVGTQFTPTSTQAPVQIQMIPTPTPIHIQMHPQTHSAVIPLAQTTASQQAQPVVLTSTQTMGVTQTQPTIQFQTQTQAQSQNQASGQTQTQQPLSATKPNASPRPSILRKRDNEGSPMKAQKNLTPMLVSMGTAPTIVIPSPSLTAPSSPPSPPKRPDSGGPQSSGSTTISATSSPGQESPPPAPQPPPSAASITAGLHAAGLHPGPPSTEMSPRKKPRKQQLTGNELQEHKISDDEMEFLTEDKEEDFHQQQQQGQQPPQQQPQQQQPHNQQPNIQQHPQGMQQQQQEQLQQSGQQQQQQQQQAQQQQTPTAPSEFYKRPNVSLLSTYRYTWKSRHNHFLRHSDVRPKDERRPTVGELASQRHILQRINGWKVHHLTTQMEDLADVESQVCQQLETMLGVMERKAEQDQDKDVNRVNELIKGNMQRSRVIADQLLEAKATVMKIFEHKTHVAEIINRSSGKRTFKKRDKS